MVLSSLPTPSLRSRLLTSTQAYTLIGGACKWLTYKALLKEKISGIIEEKEQNEAMKKGLLWEPIVARQVAARHGWKVKPDPLFYWIEELGLGTSVDWRFTDQDALNEIKTVWNEWAWRKGWGVSNGKIYKATPYVEWQIQHQMLVTGTRVIWLSVRGPRGELAAGKREANAGMHRMILDKAKEFWGVVRKAKRGIENAAGDLCGWRVA